MKKFLMVLSMIEPALKAAGIVEKLGEACLDALEEIVTRTDNTVDDALILPTIKGLRHVVGLEEKKPELKVVDNEA